MPRTHPPYPPEYRQQIVELVRAGRRPEELSRDCGPTAQTIQNWVKQADRDQGRRHDGLTTAERQDLARLIQAAEPQGVSRRRRPRTNLRVVGAQLTPDPGAGSCTWPSWWMRGAAGLWVRVWRATCEPSWSSTPWTWRSGDVIRWA